MNNTSPFLAPNYPRRASTMDSYCEAARAKKHDPFFDEKWDYKKANRARARAKRFSDKPSKQARLASEV